MEPTADLKSAEKSLIALARRLSDSDSIDPQTRRALQKATQKLSLSLETPADTLQRVSFLVRSSFPAPLSDPVQHAYKFTLVAIASSSRSRSYRPRPGLVREAGGGWAWRQERT